MQIPEDDWLLSLIIISAYITTFRRSPTEEEIQERLKLIKAHGHLSNTKQQQEQLPLFEGENNATQ